MCFHSLFVRFQDETRSFIMMFSFGKYISPRVSALIVSIWMVLSLVSVLTSCSSDKENEIKSFEVVLPGKGSVWVANGRQRKIIFKYGGDDVDTWKIRMMRDDGDIVNDYDRQVLFAVRTDRVLSSTSSSPSLLSSSSSSSSSCSVSSSSLSASSIPSVSPSSLQLPSLSLSPSSALSESSLSSLKQSPSSSSFSATSSSILSLKPSSSLSSTSSVSSSSSMSSTSSVSSLPSSPTTSKSSAISIYERLVEVEPNIQSGQYYIEVCADLLQSKSNSKEICIKSQEFYVDGTGKQKQHEDRFYKRQKELEDRLSGVNLESVWPANGTKCTVHRIHRPNKEQFTEECMKPGLPCIITGAMDNWKAMKSWRFETFQEDSRIKEGIYVGQNQEMIPLKVYYDYVKNQSQRDEKKWMVFMPDVFELYPELLKDYTVPDFLSSDEDFMDVLDDDLRLDWRWIIMAPKYSGSGWHVDPANTTGWLALITGAKLWGFYPPTEYQIPGAKNNYYQKRDYNMDDAFNWWAYTRPYLKSNVPQECVQRAGDIAFIPNGWWHSVVNLDHTVGVTQNLCNHYSFKACLKELKSQSDSDGLFIGRTFEQLRELYMDQYPEYFENDDKVFNPPEEGTGKTLDQEKQKRMEDLKKYLSGTRS